MKKIASYRLTEEADRWITAEAKQQGISKNDVVQMLVNRAMKEAETQPRAMSAAKRRRLEHEESGVARP